MDVEKVRKTLLLARQKIQSHLNEIYDAGGVEYIGLGSTLDEIDRVVKELDSESAKNTERLKAENQRLRALVSMAVEMLTFEYTAGDGVPEKFSAEWDLLLRQAQEGRG